MRIFESKWLGLPLWPLSLLYNLAIRAHNWSYEVGLGRSAKLDAFVVSVGNITVGGSGKTPFTIWLARKLIEGGRRVAVVSRGYGRRSHGQRIVSNGDRMQCSVYEAGDEPYLIASKVPSAPVIVDADRVRGCHAAIHSFQPEIILLDDAFQHRRIHRDLDIVLINARRGIGNGLTLPAGPLREPLRYLARANEILLTHCGSPLLADHPLIRQIRRSACAPITCAEYVPVGLVSLSNETRPLNWYAGKSIYAVAGIASPEQFYDTLAGLKMEVGRRTSFIDHHWYSASDLVRVEEQAQRAGAVAIVTTEKDLVRIRPHREHLSLPWYALEVELSPRDEGHWRGMISSVVEKLS